MTVARKDKGQRVNCDIVRLLCALSAQVSKSLCMPIIEIYSVYVNSEAE
jgi:hypothetical protein